MHTHTHTHTSIIIIIITVLRPTSTKPQALEMMRAYVIIITLKNVRTRVMLS